MAAMKQSLPTRIGVVALVSLGLLSATVTTYVLVGNKVGNPVATATAESPSGPAVKSYIDSLTDATFSADNKLPEKQLTQLLPNHVYKYVGFDIDPLPLAAGIAVGRVVDVEKSTADSSHYVLTLSVETGFGAVAGQTTVKADAPLASGQSVSSVRAALTSAGTVLVVLDDGTDGNATYSVRRGGALIAQIVEDRIEFMSMRPAVNASFVSGVSTLTQLITAASRPAVIGTVENGRASL